MSERRDRIVFGRPLMPRQQDFERLLDPVFRSCQLTNGGTLHDRLESVLGQETGGHVVLVSSGTMALMLALRLGGVARGGEVITTPLSFAASVQAIDWCGLVPVFADVEPAFATLCPKAVERAITPQTVAILAVHFQGIACDIAALEDIARRHKLWLVFDAAQAPDIQVSGRNICLSGDASALSLHGTKLLSTAEGGAVVVGDAAQAQALARMRNFGLEGGQMTGPGINGKMSELHAAFGLAVRPRVAAEMAARQQIRGWYDAAFEDVPQIRTLQPRPGTSASHLYYTLILPPDLRAGVIASLHAADILPRTPFPILCGPGTVYAGAVVHTTRHHAVAGDVAGQYLSLPLHGDVGRDGVARVVQAVLRGIG
ncbi:MAG: DegT/DnrJ/EryC1/StrS family aminotransferase [Pseudotabrizicola sp.]|uniref:DegT/DnrJ/EryC1/StrS family aminotransferase n=1 Tax=Pseudotabrizicola sp. TaxID=2939647 RepID=UPI00271C749E|nr:DegT/DnrJ/EryC1/StrS family aminotransferase [Pseudotabrizicola sp.]MDO9637334.1 DegT/DnrJ/EryC1/StrS family aminotransferase [Pseudotabrizicola sp.]